MLEMGSDHVYDWKRPRGRPHSIWVQQICQDTCVTVPEALLLADE